MAVLGAAATSRAVKFRLPSGRSSSACPYSSWLQKPGSRELERVCSGKHALHPRGTCVTSSRSACSAVGHGKMRRSMYAPARGGEGPGGRMHNPGCSGSQRTGRRQSVAARRAGRGWAKQGSMPPATRIKHQVLGRRACAGPSCGRCARSAQRLACFACRAAQHIHVDTPHAQTWRVGLRQGTLFLILVQNSKRQEPRP